MKSIAFKNITRGISNRFLISLIILSSCFFSISVLAQDESAVNNQRVINYINNKFSNEISNVVVDHNTVTITGNLRPGQSKVFLCELRMFDETALTFKNFASATAIKSTNFKIQLNRFIKFNDTGYDRLYSRWVIALKQGNEYKIKSFVHYAKDIERTALQYLPEEKPAGIKGLAGFWGEGGVNEDLANLGIHHVTINFVIPEFISFTPTELSYKLGGDIYYFKPSEVDKFDRTLKLCSDNNVFVSAILLIQQALTGQLKSIFVYPQANAGVQSMANITSLTGLNYYAALIGFLAERYTRPDKKFGRINSWIVHNEVDNGVYWTNAGNAKLEYYTELYDRSLRTVYYTARKHDPAAKVLLSLTHFWASTDQNTFFPPKKMLETFNRLSKQQGDYEWGIAYHPYAQDLFNPQVWIGDYAINNISNTKYITPKNIELIDQWMCMPDNLYNGLKVRTLLFSEQGVHSKSYSENDLKMQAAGVAYMWKKFSHLPSLESFDYHRQTDHINEGGFKPGLWTVRPGTMVSPEKQKPAWFVYQKAGTSVEDSAFAFALPLIGISDWQQVYNPIKEQAKPVNITFKITKGHTSLNNASIYFNGEMHKTINGTAVFYNVASLPIARTYTIKVNAETLQTKTVTITSAQTINISL